MPFGNSAGSFGGSAVRRQVGHDSAAAMSKLVVLLPNCMQIVENWSEKGVIVAVFLYSVCKGQATLCVQSAQYRTRSSDIALLHSLKQCSADREYTH